MISQINLSIDNIPNKVSKSYSKYCQLKVYTYLKYDLEIFSDFLLSQDITQVIYSKHFHLFYFSVFLWPKELIADFGASVDPEQLIAYQHKFLRVYVILVEGPSEFVGLLVHIHSHSSPFFVWRNTLYCSLCTALKKLRKLRNTYILTLFLLDSARCTIISNN